MHIARLKLRGFKSFADETEIKFLRGINCIVGPNGCGKSNIVDALKWVVGDTSSKGMRASNLKDMVFKGAEGRRGARTAEVSITLFSDELFPFEEITVSRRIRSNGESEFSINGKRVRLKDVQDLFLDIGLGNRNYSFFEQGQIDRVLRLKPTERRLLIDEAAGITKFKERKEETLKKLEEAKSNLEVVKQVLGEVGRNLKSLKVQADRAKEYRRLKSLERETELLLNGLRLKRLREKRDALSAEKEALEERKASIESDIGVMRENLSDLKSELERVERGIKDASERLFDLEKRERELSVRGEFLKRDVEELRKEIENLSGERKEKERKVAELKGEIGSLLSEKRDIEDEISRREAELSSLRERIAGKERERAEIRRDIDRVKEKLLQVKGSISELNVDIARERERERFSAEERSSIPAEISNLKRELSFYLKEIEKRSLELHGISRRIEELLEEKEELQSLMDEKAEAVEEIRGDVSDLRERVASLRSRIESIEELLNSFDFEKLEKMIVESGMRGKVKGYIGLLLNLIEVDEGWEKAVEAYLSRFGAGIVVKTFEDVVWIKERVKGRGKALVLSADVKPLKGKYFEDATPLLSHVRARDARVSDLVNVIFSNVFYTSSNAHRLARENPDCIFIDKDFNVFSGKGSIVGKVESKGIIELERKLEGLKSELKSLQEELEERRSSLSSAEEDMKRLRAKVEELEERESGLRAERFSLEREMGELDSRAKSRKGRLVELEKRLSELESSSSNASSIISKLEERLNDLGAEEERLSQSLKDLEAELSRLNQEIAGLRRKESSESSAIAVLKEKLRSLEDAISSRRHSLKSLEEDVAGFGRKREELFFRMKSGEEELVSIGDTLSGVKRAVEGAKLELSSLEEKRSSLLNMVRENERLLKEKEESLKGILKEISDREIEVAKLNVKEEEIVDSILSLGASISGALERAKGDEEELKRELIGIKEKLTGIGAVNFLAAEEYEKLKERYSFVLEQERDLLDSIKNLNEAIEKLDREITERFSKTLRSVNRAFRDIFRRVFGGGKARVYTVGDDITTAGIEIEAKPPGKKHSSINLLSGGERTLVALSLLFALYSVKPSPFVVLDEVDAALDDVNTQRFTELLKELSEKTQVIVITHNKLTMEIADIIYGVTMEVPGISKVVGVSFQTLAPASL